MTTTDYVSPATMLAALPDLVTIHVSDAGPIRSVEIRYRPRIPDVFGPGQPYDARFAIDVAAGRLAPSDDAQSPPLGEVDGAFGRKVDLRREEVAGRGLALPDDTSGPGPDLVADFAFGRRPTRPLTFVREHVAAAVGIAGYAENSGIATDEDREGPSKQAVEDCIAAIERRISEVFAADVAPLLSPSETRLVAVLRDAATFDWRVYRAISVHPRWAVLCAFIERNPLVGVQILAVEEAFEAIASGAGDTEAFLLARGRLGARPPSYASDLGRWSEALFARAGGIVWDSRRIEPARFIRSLPEIPLDWFPQENEFKAFCDVMNIWRCARLGPDEGAAELMPGCKGRWHAYSRRLADAAGDDIWLFTMPDTEYRDTPDGRVRVFRIGSLRLMAYSFVRQVVVPAALLHADEAPKLAAMATIAIDRPLRRFSSSIEGLLFAGMDLPSRLASRARYAETRRARLGVLNRHPPRTTEVWTEAPPRKGILRPEIACTPDALREMWKAWRHVVPRRLRTDDVAELARRLDREIADLADA